MRGGQEAAYQQKLTNYTQTLQKPGLKIEVETRSIG
jgi:hypothetical protein